MVVAAALALVAIVLCSCGTGNHPPPPRSTERPPLAQLLFTWEGYVDGRDLLKFRGDSCQVEHIENRPIRDMQFQLYHPLDADCFPVVLVKEAGRGKIKLIRQGDRFNRFTLLVEVDDMPYGKAGFYRFSVYRSQPEVGPKPVFRMYAEVDDEAVFVLRGHKVTVTDVSGLETRRFRYQFLTPRGIDPRGRYRLEVIQGRGQVLLLPPTPGQEDIRIMIRDKSKGSSVYEVALIPVGRISDRATRQPAGD